MAPDPENLILRAARLLRREAGVSAGCIIDCWKRIPIGAGLGGGSADAAATLLALNRLWGVRADARQLGGLAGQLGADVPFLVRGGTALATGTGRAVDPLPDAPSLWGVLVPMEADSGAKTAEMYRELHPSDFSDGAGIHRQAEAIRSGRLSPEDVCSAFTKAAAARWPSVGGSLTSLAATAPVAASLSGAGPSVFALYASRARARAAWRALGSPARLFRFVSAEVVSDHWVYSPNNL
jgi:4-diphosphocytidyl-2-C-methyl-D-erythritol kinase